MDGHVLGRSLSPSRAPPGARARAVLTQSPARSPAAWRQRELPERSTGWEPQEAGSWPRVPALSRAARPPRMAQEQARSCTSALFGGLLLPGAWSDGRGLLPECERTRCSRTRLSEAQPDSVVANPCCVPGAVPRTFQSHHRGLPGACFPRSSPRSQDRPAPRPPHERPRQRRTRPVASSLAAHTPGTRGF